MGIWKLRSLCIRHYHYNIKFFPLINFDNSLCSFLAASFWLNEVLELHNVCICSNPIIHSAQSGGHRSQLRNRLWSSIFLWPTTFFRVTIENGAIFLFSIYLTSRHVKFILLQYKQNFSLLVNNKVKQNIM